MELINATADGLGTVFKEGKKFFIKDPSNPSKYLEVLDIANCSIEELLIITAYCLNHSYLMEVTKTNDTNPYDPNDI